MSGIHLNGASSASMGRRVCLRTIWAELGDKFPEIFNLCAEQTLENATMDQEMKRPMTSAEEERCKAGIPRETIAEERIWNKSPDGLAIEMPTSEKVGVFVMLEFKRMSERMSHLCIINNTGKRRSGSSIRIHKVGTRTNAWLPRMVGEPEKLHSRSMISQ